ncbi:MAG: 6-pyruvoyl tetrahydrobiopterin synthase [uncultured bacterium]|nr:MAG: 6-pyruvoyl tetrahydrobiopterin synthase [uncultured bacterium]
MKIMELKKEFSFEASHYLPNAGKKHKCSSLHGHGFKVIFSVKGKVDKKYGWVMDFGQISLLVKPLIDKLDHSNLNEIKGLENPTSENIAIWFWEKLKKDIPLLHSIEVKESDKSSCVFFG